MNKTGGRVVKNAAWIVGCKVIKAVLTLVVTMLTARYLGPANFGVVNYAASLVAFVAPIMKLGLDSTLVHEIVKDPEREGGTVGTALTLCLISGLLCMAGVTSFSLVANRGDNTQIVVCAIYSILLLFQALEMLSYWFQAKLMSRYSAVAMLIGYVAVTAVQIVLLVTHVSIYWFTASYLVEYLVMVGVMLAIFAKKSQHRLFFSWKIAKSMLRVSKYYIVSALMVTIFSQTDKIMIKLMISDEATGWYSAAATSAGMVSFVFAAVIDSMRPTIFESAEQKEAGEAAFERKLTYLYSIIIYFSLAVSLILTLLAPYIILLLYGDAYAPSADVLRVVVWFTTFSYLGTVRNIWILAKDKQKFLWVINGTGALLNIGLNFAFIPLWGIVGAAAASLITQFFTNVVMGFIIRPISRNNTIMLKGLDPRSLAAVFRILFSKNKGPQTGENTENSDKDENGDEDEKDGNGEKNENAEVGENSGKNGNSEEEKIRETDEDEKTGQVDGAQELDETHATDGAEAEKDAHGENSEKDESDGEEKIRKNGEESDNGRSDA